MHKRWISTVCTSHEQVFYCYLSVTVSCLLNRLVGNNTWLTRIATDWAKYGDFGAHRSQSESGKI